MKMQRLSKKLESSDFISKHQVMFDGCIMNEVTMWTAPSWFDSSVSRALQHYRKGQWFETIQA